MTVYAKFQNTTFHNACKETANAMKEGFWPKQYNNIKRAYYKTFSRYAFETFEHLKR